MLDEYYESTVVMFATSQHSLGEQFFEETKKNDLLAFGETEDAERLLQILNSHRIRNRIIEKYDLYTHYDIDPSEPGAKTDMALTYGSNVSKLDAFGSIRVQVLDTDPELARDMANDMAFLVDSVANNMRNERAKEAYKLAIGALAKTSEQIAQAKTAWPRCTRGHLRFRNASGRFDGPIRHGRGFRRSTSANVLKKTSSVLVRWPTASTTCRRTSKRPTNSNPCSKTCGIDARGRRNAMSLLHRGLRQCSGQKAKPVRWLIVVMTSVVAVGAAFLAMLAWDTLQRAQNAS